MEISAAEPEDEEPADLPAAAPVAMPRRAMSSKAMLSAPLSEEALKEAVTEPLLYTQREDGAYEIGSFEALKQFLNKDYTNVAAASTLLKEAGSAAGSEEKGAASATERVILTGDIDATETLEIREDRSITLESDTDGQDNQASATISKSAGGFQSISSISYLFHVAKGAILTLKNAILNGGGVNTEGTFNMEGGEITGINNNDSRLHNAEGAAVDVKGESAQFNLSGGSIHDNTLQELSLIKVADNAVMNMSGGSITNNKANVQQGTVSIGYFGGSQQNQGGTLNLSGGEISNNINYGWGGGVGVWNDSTMIMTGGKITGNQAGTNGGGVAVYADPGRKTTFVLNGRDAEISHNCELCKKVTLNAFTGSKAS